MKNTKIKLNTLVIFAITLVITLLFGNKIYAGCTIDSGPTYHGTCKGPDTSTCSYDKYTNISTQVGTAYYGGNCSRGYGIYSHKYTCTYAGYVCSPGDSPDPKESSCWPEPISYQACNPSASDFHADSLYASWYAWTDTDRFGTLVNQTYLPNDRNATTGVLDDLNFETHWCSHDCVCGPDDAQECQWGCDRNPNIHRTDYFGVCSDKGIIPVTRGACDKFFGLILQGWVNISSSGNWSFRAYSNKWGHDAIGQHMAYLYMLDRNGDGRYEPACNNDYVNKKEVVGWWKPLSQPGATVGSHQWEPLGRHYPNASVTKSWNLEAGWYPIEIRYAQRDYYNPEWKNIDLRPYYALQYKCPGCSDYQYIPDENLRPDDFYSKNCPSPSCNNSCPSASISTATTTLRIGTNYLFNGTASDLDGNLSFAQMHWAPENTFTQASDWTQLGVDQSCSGSTCSISRSWRPTRADYDRAVLMSGAPKVSVTINAYDTQYLTTKGECTGNPARDSNPSAFSSWCDCGTTDNIRNIRLCGVGPNAPTGPVSPPNDPTGGNPQRFTFLSISWTGTGFGDACVANNHYLLHLKPSGGTETVIPVTGAAFGTIGTTVSNLMPNTLYEWWVESSNGEEANAMSSHWYFKTESNQPESGWFTVTNGGDVFGSEVELLGATSSTDLAVCWNPAYISYDPGAVLSSGDINPGTNLAEADVSNSGIWSENITMKSINAFWPALYDSFSLPEGAEEINNPAGFHNLDPSKVYYISSSTLTAGSNWYDLQAPGVAVIYYLAGSGNLSLGGEFTHKDSSVTNEKVLFITNRPVTIANNIDNTNACADTPASVQAAIITNQTITFISDGDGGIDESIVVEGPLAGKTGILFNRITNNNGYPGEIIRYSPYYLYGLTSQIRNAPTDIYNGLYVSEITWETE